jgi:hypothetical protein
MKFALLFLLAVGCATAPEVTVPPVVVPDPPPRPEAKLPEHKSCPGPTSTVSISRNSAAMVDLQPGGQTRVAWTLTVDCGAISLEGMDLIFTRPDGVRFVEKLRPDAPNVFITGQTIPVSTPWKIYPNTPPGIYVITVEPLWLDSYTLKRYHWARNSTESAVRIRVTEPANGI